MKAKKAKKVTVALLSILCALTVCAGFSTVKTDKAKAADDTVYSQDFESLSTSLNGDEIYGNTGWAGGTRSIVRSTGAYIKAPYRFGSEGHQDGHVYTDTNRCVSATEEGKSYTLTMRIKPYGDFKDLTFAVQSPVPEKYNSVIIFNKGQAGYAVDYVEGSGFVTVNSAEVGVDGWYDVNATIKGTGGYVCFVFYMNVDKDRYAEINEADATGFCLESFRFAQGEKVVYEMNVPSGLSGNDAIFAACGLAGFRSSAVTEKEGINGNTLRAKLDFLPTSDGAFQKGELYSDQNVLMINFEEGKTYYVRFALKPFGKVGTTYCLFRQVGVDNTDPQIILNADRSWRAVEYGSTKMFEETNVKVDGDVYYVTAAVKGLGKPFQLLFRMQSSDAEAANSGADTGFCFDDFSVATEKAPEVDPTEGEYKTVLSRNFNSDSLDVSGGDEMFHTNGFAGVSGGRLTIKKDGFKGDGDRCLSAMFAYNEHGYQTEPLYISCGETAEGAVYKYDMLVKPTGTVDNFYVRICSARTNVYDNVLFREGTFVAEPAAAGSRFIKAVVNGYENGVYDVSIYAYGSDGNVVVFFQPHCTDPDSANVNFDSGLLVDDFSMSVKKIPDPAGFNVTERLYNVYGGADLKINSTFADVAEITVDGEALASESYTFENGLFTFKAAYLAGLSGEAHAIVAKNAAGEESTLSLTVENTSTANIHTEDFSKMPELKGDQDAKDNFFRYSWFDPANYNVYTEGADETRVIKFVPASVSDGEICMFQTNPNDGRMHYLTKNKLHTLSMDFKPLGAKVITLKGFAHGSVDTNLFTLEIDLSDGKKVSGTQNANLGYDVIEKADGWYSLSVSFRFTEAEESNSYAFVQFFSPAASLEAAWYLDNFTVDSEVFAELGATEARYDRASSTRPYAIIDLRAFEIVSVKEGETLLVKDTDYTLSETPTGSLRLDLTEAFCAKYNLGDQKTISVFTTKNTLEFAFTVVDTEPEMDETAALDVAYGVDLKMTADFKGYEIEKLEADGEELGGAEYMLDSDGKFVLKYNYLKGLSVGSHTFVIYSKSGATKTLTLTIKDSTPVFNGGAVYDKTTNADYTVSVDLFEKEITEVRFDGTVLTGEEYSFADGVLTIRASVLQAKNAGKYILTVTTVASRELELEIKDVAPVISGDYTIEKGGALNLTVDLGGKEILSIKAGELVLTESDYSYENGVLTINAEVLSELAEGEQTIALTTTGGSVTKLITLTAASASTDDGCTSSLGGGSLVLFGLSALATALLKRKQSER